MRQACATENLSRCEIVRLRTVVASRMAFAIFALAALSACEQNSFVPPPPPKVDVALPVQRSITRYLEATGNTAAIKNVDLVARVQGFLQSIDYQDGSFVKEGTTLFTIEPETYKLKLEQAQAAEAGRFAGNPRYLHFRARQRPGQSAASAGQYQNRRGQLRLHEGRRPLRRHRHRASGFGR